MSFLLLASFSMIVLGSVTISILFIKSNSFTGRMLAFFLLLNIFTLFTTFLFESGYILSMPHFFRTALPVNYMLAPVLFLYISFSLDQSKRMNWKHSLHFLPLVVCMVDFLPFWLTSAGTKRKSVEQLLNHPELILKFREGWFLPGELHYYALTLISAGYFLLIASVLFRHHSQGMADTIKKKSLFRWLITLTTLCFVQKSALFISSLTLPPSIIWYTTILSLLFIILSVCILLFFKPDILYSKFYRVSPPESLRITHRQLTLPEHTTAQIQHLLKGYIDKQHYLRKNVTLLDVAQALGVQSYILSAYINQVHHMHFNDLINFYRIEHIKQELLGKDRDMLTLEAIAEKAGYNNRTTFLTAFKKFTGVTPTTFIRNFRDNPMQLTSGKQAEQPQ